MQKITFTAPLARLEDGDRLQFDSFEPDLIIELPGSNNRLMVDWYFHASMAKANSDAWGAATVRVRDRDISDAFQRVQRAAQRRGVEPDLGGIIFEVMKEDPAKPGISFDTYEA